MFGFSRRRMKIGRLKVHLGDSAQGARSPLRPTKRHSHTNGDNMGTAPPTNGPSDDLNWQASAAACSLSKCSSGNNENWMVVSTSGDKPAPRAHHAAAVVGSRMVVVGGESGRELLDDTQVLSLEKLTWAIASPKVYLSPTGLPLKIPACRGHSLDILRQVIGCGREEGGILPAAIIVSWGKKVLLVGGKTEPTNDKVSVWSFDTDTECWSLIEAKGDIPVARGGHTVVRAGPVLILFGGEDAKGKKLNDLHMFDLKSSMWLPLHYTGTGPSPRCNHVAALYDDRILFVFGGQSKSRILNDLYSLDFETMVWSRIKVQGHHPSPRADCCGVLCGTKWYITGGGSKKKRYAETLLFDVLKHEMSVAVSSHPTSVTANKGFSVVAVHHKDKVFFVAFGGIKKEPSNQVEILIMEKDENSMSWKSAVDNPSISESGVTELVSHLKSNAVQSSTNSALRHSLASAIEHHYSARRSLSESKVDPNSSSGGVSLRKQFHHDEDENFAMKLHKALEDEKFKESEDCSQVSEQRNKVQETVVKMDTASSITNTDEDALFLEPESSSCYQNLHRGCGSLLLDSDDVVSPGPDGKPIICASSNISQLYETKIAALVRKNVHLEGQLATALVSRENAEKKLPSLLKSKQELERRLGDAVKEVEVLKEKLASAELAQEEANSISNMVHSDNVKLEHDVAFLKAVLEDTQKELHSTRGVLSGERARAFQLQVEVFHLKQRLQSLENRALTPRKPFQV